MGGVGAVEVDVITTSRQCALMSRIYCALCAAPSGQRLRGEQRGSANTTQRAADTALRHGPHVEPWLHEACRRHTEHGVALGKITTAPAK